MNLKLCSFAVICKHGSISRQKIRSGPRMWLGVKLPAVPAPKSDHKCDELDLVGTVEMGQSRLGRIYPEFTIGQPCALDITEQGVK